MLNLWDTGGGGEDYPRLRPLSYPGTDVLCLCFDITNRRSFDNIKTHWMPEFNQYCPDVPIILVGNKIDLRQDQDVLTRLFEEGKTVVSTDEGHLLAAEINAAKYMETSACTSEGVKEVFFEAFLIFNRKLENYYKKVSREYQKNYIHFLENTHKHTHTHTHTHTSYKAHNVLLIVYT